ITHSRLVHNLHEYDLHSREYALLPVLSQGNFFFEQVHGKHSEAPRSYGASGRISGMPLLKTRVRRWSTVSNLVGLPLTSFARSRLIDRYSARRIASPVSAESPRCSCFGSFSWRSSPAYLSSKRVEA